MNGWLRAPIWLRLYRAGMLLVFVALIYQQARWLDGQRAPSISLRQARKFFPAAYRVQLRDPERGLHFVSDAGGGTIGCLLTTSPQTDHIIGYSGPNDLLVALDARGAVVGLEILRSGDTAEHVRKVKEDPGFFRSLLGWKPSEESAPKIAAVSGATLTSFAIAESVRHRLAGATPSLRFPEPVTLVEVQALFSNATQVAADRGRLRVLDAAGHLLGFAMRTSPQADNVSGYRGPTECLVALGPDGRTVQDLRIRRSYDTDSYVDQIRRAEQFLKMFRGHSLEELRAFEFRKDRIEGVSGATQTAQAVAEGLARRAASEMRAQRPAPAWRPQSRDWGLVGVMGGALVMAFTSWRGHRWLRLLWQLLLVGYVGLVNHDLLSLALLGGWAAHGLALKAAPGLVLLAAAALLVPWTTRRQLYCHQICPHGAAQLLVGQILRRRWSPPARLARGLECVPGFLLGLALLVLLLGWPVNLAGLEPFDAWVWRAAGLASLILAGVSLVAALFIPQAYCRFGCPTGALLSFVRSAGSADRWGRRDWIALALLAVALMAVAGARARPQREPAPEPLRWTGPAMGTTWSVKIHDEVADPATMEQAVADKFEWAESLISHWRTNTDLAVFNRTATTEPMPVPWPVLTLSRWAREISRATDGAYDITVGPLVRLWRFGPAARREVPPEAEVAAVLPAVGWQKLEVLDGMLRKRHPELEVDLSSIGEGWAIDQVAQLLERRGYTNFLIEAGGELRAQGRWSIAIEHPTRACVLTNESIGTAGTYRQNYSSGGQRYSHLIDPRTGRPVTHRTVSVSVRHADCAQADAWATALNVLGIEAGLPLAERLNLAAEFVVEKAERKFELTQSTAWKAREALAADRPKADR